MSLEAQSDVDDLCSEVHAKFPQLTGISAAELIVSWEGAPLDPSNQWRRDAPLTDVRTTCDSPLYIHAPTTESAAALNFGRATSEALLSLFCNDHLTCGANADATFTYSQVPLVASEARAAYDLLTKNNTSLPGREELNRTITEWLTSRRGGFDETRSEVPVIVNAPGTGKTTLLLWLATALEGLISSDSTSEKRPVVVAFTYNTEMAKNIPHKLLWPDADEDQRIERCVALRMLYGALRSMGCSGVKTWPEVLMTLQADGLAAAIQDPAWALRILEAWFGTDREFVVAADELLKGVTERKEANTTKQIATQLHSLMDYSGRHVVLSAMDASLINSGMSNRQPLFLSFGHLEYADVEAYMKTTLEMDLTKMPTAEERWKLRAIYAMSSGHARTLSKILRAVKTTATSDTRDNKRKPPLDSIHRSTILGVASRAIGRPAEVYKRDVNGVLLRDGTGFLKQAYEEVTMCTIEYALQVGRTEPKTIEGWFEQEILSPAENQSALKVSELISAGHAHTTASVGVRGDVEDCELFALDITTAHLLTFVQSVKTAKVSADRFPALRLLCEALKPPLGRSLRPDDLGERCYMYAGAFALSHPYAGPREAVFPGLNAALKAESESEKGKNDGFGWTNGDGAGFSTKNLQPVDLTLAHGGISFEEWKKQKADGGDTWKVKTWNEQKQAELWERLVDPQFLEPPTVDGVWQARLVAAPQSCPAIDWVWVFKSRSKTVYWGGQGKTYFYNAPGGNLDDKKKTALTRNTQVHRAPHPHNEKHKLSAITFYSANTLAELVPKVEPEVVPGPMTPAAATKLTVVLILWLYYSPPKLKAELASRGLKVSGLKDVLLERLQAAPVEQVEAATEEMRSHQVTADDLSKHFAPSLLALMTIIAEREN